MLKIVNLQYLHWRVRVDPHLGGKMNKQIWNWNGTSLRRRQIILL